MASHHEKHTIPNDDAAQLLGVSLRRLHNIVKEGMLIRSAPGSVTVESMAAYLAKQRADAIAVQDEPGDYEADKARKMKADADLAELLTAKEGRKLVELAKIERRWCNAFSSLRGKCMAIPPRLGPMVVIAKSAGAASKMLDDELRNAFDAIADAGPPDDDKPEPSAE